MESLDVSSVRHPGERWSLVVALVLFLILFVALAASVFGLIWGLVFVGLEMVSHQLAMAYFRANSVLVNQSQYPKLYEMAKRFSRKLGLSGVPDIYITQGTVLNAFATRLARRRVIVLYSHTIETMMEGEDFRGLEMVVAHELGHLAANHLRWQFVVGAVGLVFPPLYLYWSRTCEYTADRLAYLCADDKKGAINSLVKLMVGKQMAAEVNYEEILKQYQSSRGDLWIKAVESWASHPNLLKRLHRLVRYARQQRAEQSVVGGVLNV